MAVWQVRLSEFRWKLEYIVPDSRSSCIEGSVIEVGVPVQLRSTGEQNARTHTRTHAHTHTPLVQNCNQLTSYLSLLTTPFWSTPDLYIAFCHWTPPGRSAPAWWRLLTSAGLHDALLSTCASHHIIRYIINTIVIISSSNIQVDIQTQNTQTYVQYTPCQWQWQCDNYNLVVQTVQQHRLVSITMDR